MGSMAKVVVVVPEKLPSVLAEMVIVAVPTEMLLA